MAQEKKPDWGVYFTLILAVFVFVSLAGDSIRTVFDYDAVVQCEKLSSQFAKNYTTSQNSQNAKELFFGDCIEHDWGAAVAIDSTLKERILQEYSSKNGLSPELTESVQRNARFFKNTQRGVASTVQIIFAFHELAFLLLFSAVLILWVISFWKEIPEAYLRLLTIPTFISSFFILLLVIFPFLVMPLRFTSVSYTADLTQFLSIISSPFPFYLLTLLPWITLLITPLISILKNVRIGGWLTFLGALLLLFLSIRLICSFVLSIKSSLLALLLGGAAFLVAILSYFLFKDDKEKAVFFLQNAFIIYSLVFLFYISYILLFTKNSDFTKLTALACFLLLFLSCALLPLLCGVLYSDLEGGKEKAGEREEEK